MEEYHGEDCCCPNTSRQENGILYGLLASPSSTGTLETCNVHQAADTDSGSQNISCCVHHQIRPCHHHHHHHHHHRHHHNFQQNTIKVSLKYPDIIEQEAAELLLKSMVFVKNLPSFWQLRREDRLQLFLNGWSDLLILNMAQHNFQFDVKEHIQDTQSQDQTNAKMCPTQPPMPALSDVKKVKNFIHRCQLLRLDDKEYAYMKSIVFFNPELPSVLNGAAVEECQNNAQLCLSEYLAAMYPDDPLRFARVLLGLPTLRDIKPQVLIELFFRPLIGDVCMEEVLAAMLEQE